MKLSSMMSAKLNQVSKDKIGIEIFDQEGKICMQEVLSVTPKILSKIKYVKQIKFKDIFSSDSRKLELILENVTKTSQVPDLEDTDTDELFEGEEINLDNLSKKVDAVKKLIKLVFAEFDMLHLELLDVLREFDIDRLSKIKTAEDILETYLNNGNEVNMNELKICVSNVEVVINAFMEVIRTEIDSITNVPKDRIQRLLKCNPKKVMGSEVRARHGVLSYIRGVLVYVKIRNILNQSGRAHQMIEKSIYFLTNFTPEKLERVEGWNAEESMDGFWIEKFPKFSDSLLSLKNICNENNSILIDVRR